MQWLTHLVGARHGQAGTASETQTRGLIITSAWRYDLLLWLGNLMTRGKWQALRQTTADLAQLHAGEQVLDVGCGTGTLALIALRFQIGQVGALEQGGDFGLLGLADDLAVGAREGPYGGVGEHLPLLGLPPQQARDTVERQILQPTRDNQPLVRRQDRIAGHRVRFRPQWRKDLPRQLQSAKAASHRDGCVVVGVERLRGKTAGDSARPGRHPPDPSELGGSGARWRCQSHNVVCSKSSSAVSGARVATSSEGRSKAASSVMASGVWSSTSQMTTRMWRIGSSRAIKIARLCYHTPLDLSQDLFALTIFASPTTSLDVARQKSRVEYMPTTK
jgi:hypothetical protein